MIQSAKTAKQLARYNPSSMERVTLPELVGSLVGGHQ
jgi:hypothetical protein